ncbi:unnamed protein product [Didymodactylos carnosus]|uniref:SET domain-containing protein n=1 Tax=Didymodactylos carnosus TaxID=1234261 RepID=A0A8S2FHJ6_9BILA|nr:unnamed protein product [Didymodactylos carnosus]CAF4258914.1 unnamed protein product [Didymodactylos carnosus]
MTDSIILDNFQNWFSKQLAVDGTCPQWSSNFGYGLYSTRYYSPNEIVLSVPSHLFITPQSISVAPVELELSGFECLILYLIRERQKGHESVIEPYIQMLLATSPIPVWRKYFNDFPSQVARVAKKHLEKYQQSQEKLLFIKSEENEFQWAYYAVNTRCVSYSLAGETIKRDENEDLCLIPYLDFVNHSNDPNTIGLYNSLTSSYEIKTLREIHPDEQVTFSYNPHSNIDLFIEYGFVLPQNPYNIYHIKSDLELWLKERNFSSIDEKIQLLNDYNYYTTLELYSASRPSWTVLKTIELFITEKWQPNDEAEENDLFLANLNDFLTFVKNKFENEFEIWLKENKTLTRMNAIIQILYEDFKMLLNENINMFRINNTIENV